MHIQQPPMGTYHCTQHPRQTTTGQQAWGWSQHQCAALSSSCTVECRFCWIDCRGGEHKWACWLASSSRATSCFPAPQPCSWRVGRCSFSTTATTWRGALVSLCTRVTSPPLSQYVTHYNTHCQVYLTSCFNGSWLGSSVGTIICKMPPLDLC